MAAKRYGRTDPRRGTVYIAVSGTALLISLIGLTVIQISRLELRESTNLHDQSYARFCALSAAELALSLPERFSDWRTRYTHNVEVTLNPTGYDKPLYFKFIDNVDGDLGNNDTDAVEIQGIGRCGGATVIYSVDYAPSVTSSDQVALVVSNYEGSTSTNTTLSANSYLGHYFVPSLPAEAVSWSVTSVDVYLQQHGSPDGTLYVNFYTPDGSGNPNTLIESVALAETVLPTGSNAWHPVTFTRMTDLTPGDGFCLALEGSDPGNTAIVPYATGVSQTNSHLLRGGSGTWYTPDATQSIQYRVNGVYTTSTGSGEFTATPGSWKTKVVP